MNKRTLKLWIGTPAIFLVGWAGAANAAVVPDSDHVAKLLAEAKTLAFQVKDDAVAMEGFTRMNVSWESHAVAINQIRDHVNALEKQEAKLKDARTRLHRGKGPRSTGSCLTWTSWKDTLRPSSNA